MFDSGDRGDPYDATVRFRGRRVGASGQPGPGDFFVHDEAIEGIIPGTGAVTITATVHGLRAGEWTVGAEVLRSRAHEGSRPVAEGSQRGSTPAYPTRWSWRRWAVAPTPDAPERTRWALIAPLARIPAVAPGAYTALAVLGAVLALALQTAILGRQGVDAGAALAVSLAALGSGLAGAKIWYTLLHPNEPLLRGGWAVDGFLVVAPVVATVGLLALGLPVGRVLDAATPGIFLAVALGRVGCLLAGCCAGRCTAARLGLWSSDRRVGARRVPTQLMESAVGVVVGLVSLGVVLGVDGPIHGLVFIVAFAAYSAARQVLLRLRVERRARSGSVPLTAGAAAVVLLLVGAVSLLQIAGNPTFG